MAHAPDVDVYEVRAAIVSHSSAMQAQGCVAQFRRWNPGQANVDGFSLHVQAMTRHAGVGAARPQEFIAPKGAVTTNHVDLTIGVSERRSQIVKEIEEARIEMTYISGAVVAQKIVELVERFGDVLVTAAINNVEPLTRVSVIKAQVIFAPRRGTGYRVSMPEQRRGQKRQQKYENQRQTTKAGFRIFC